MPSRSSRCYHMWVLRHHINNRHGSLTASFLRMSTWTDLYNPFNQPSANKHSLSFWASCWTLLTHPILAWPQSVLLNVLGFFFSLRVWLCTGFPASWCLCVGGRTKCACVYFFYLKKIPELTRGDVDDINLQLPFTLFWSSKLFPRIPLSYCRGIGGNITN